jgi:hypothetical protein
MCNEEDEKRRKRRKIWREGGDGMEGYWMQG